MPLSAPHSSKNNVSECDVTLELYHTIKYYMIQLLSQLSVTLVEKFIVGNLINIH